MARKEYDFALFSNMQKLKSMDLSEQQLKGIYSTFRDIAVKRAKRIESSDLGDLVQPLTIPKIRGQSMADLQHNLVLVSKWLKSPTSTLGGLRVIEERKQASREAIGIHIAAGDRKAFYDFMKEAERLIGQSSQYDSDKAVEIFEMVANSTLEASEVLRDFEFYYDNIYTAQDVIEEHPRVKTWNSDKIRRYLRQR